MTSGDHLNGVDYSAIRWQCIWAAAEGRFENVCVLVVSGPLTAAEIDTSFGLLVTSGGLSRRERAT